MYFGCVHVSEEIENLLLFILYFPLTSAVERADAVHLTM